MDLADLVGAPLNAVLHADGQGASAAGQGGIRTLVTLVAFFVGGGALLALEAALMTPERPTLEVTVASDATEAEVARAIDEALLVDQGLRLGWRNDPLIVDRLTRALEELTPAGTAVLDHAEALGLPTRDPLVRARLMENARRSLPEPGAPPAAELDAWFAANGARFERPARLTFEHRFTRDFARAERMLAAANASADTGQAGQGEPDRGEPELTLGPRPVRTTMALAAALGGAAAASIARAQAGQWVLVRSPLGYHVVRVESRQPAGIPPLDIIRPEVIAAWRQDQRPGFEAKALARARQAFTVHVTRLPPLQSEAP